MIGSAHARTRSLFLSTHLLNNFILLWSAFVPACWPLTSHSSDPWGSSHIILLFVKICAEICNRFRQFLAHISTSPIRDPAGTTTVTPECYKVHVRSSLFYTLLQTKCVFLFAEKPQQLQLSLCSTGNNNSTCLTHQVNISHQPAVLFSHGKSAPATNSSKLNSKAT